LSTYGTEKQDIEYKGILRLMA